MKKFKNLPILFTLIICLMSCSSDDDKGNNGPDGSIASIENFYTPELLNTLDELGFIINSGTTPPIIDGAYLANPLTLANSNIPGDNIGNTYSDLLMTFTNQSNDNLTLNYEGQYEGQVGNNFEESVQSYITGSDDSFSIFLKVEHTDVDDNHTYILATAFSGTLSSEGILNYQYALIMLDDNGDPNDDLIENNEGRLIVDGNGLCDVITPDSRVSDTVNILKQGNNNPSNSSKSF